MSDERKGLFTPEQEDKLAALADEAIVLKNPLFEGLDGPILRQAIKALDNMVFEKIPQDTQSIIEPILDEIVKALPEAK